MSESPVALEQDLEGGVRDPRQGARLCGDDARGRRDGVAALEEFDGPHLGPLFRLQVPALEPHGALQHKHDVRPRRAGIHERMSGGEGAELGEVAEGDGFGTEEALRLQQRVETRSALHRRIPRGMSARAFAGAAACRATPRHVAADTRGGRPSRASMGAPPRGGWCSATVATSVPSDSRRDATRQGAVGIVELLGERRAAHDLHELRASHRMVVSELAQIVDEHDRDDAGRIRGHHRVAAHAALAPNGELRRHGHDSGTQRRRGTGAAARPLQSRMRRKVGAGRLRGYRGCGGGAHVPWAVRRAQAPRQ